MSPCNMIIISFSMTGVGKIDVTAAFIFLFLWPAGRFHGLNINQITLAETPLIFSDVLHGQMTIL